ncbi:MAG TPA: flagellar basal body L-ring protein FlgH [bacterium]|jgi:flagellar L-ring protein precursor FlgH|nr:flagellar basal body L-ring protein FlgH [bacterium]
MKRIQLVSAVVLSALAAFAAPAGADSLWPGGSSDFGNVSNGISDNRALKVGDIVTIRINESATATQSSQMSTNKQASVAGGAGQGNFAPNQGMPITSFGVGGEESFDGGGTNANSGALVTTLSARIISVLDSGNLVIQGQRSVKINSEKQNIFIKGVIRPKDVDRNNTVLSSVISDEEISYSGRGPLSEKSHPGFFSRFMDWLGIF